MRRPREYELTAISPWTTMCWDVASRANIMFSKENSRRTPRLRQRAPRRQGVVQKEKVSRYHVLFVRK
jgi:hypothetical protein